MDTFCITQLHSIGWIGNCWANQRFGINKPDAVKRYVSLSMYAGVLATWILSEILEDRLAATVNSVAIAYFAIRTTGWIVGFACGGAAARRTENPLTMRETLQLSVTSTLLSVSMFSAIEAIKFTLFRSRLIPFLLEEYLKATQSPPYAISYAEPNPCEAYVVNPDDSESCYI